jgi:hypothetical protein
MLPKVRDVYNLEKLCAASAAPGRVTAEA